MKLLRYGPKGFEKPGLLDADGHIRDLSGLLDDITPKTLAPAALAVPRSDLRLFGKPEAFTRRRMGVAVANGADVDEARARAKLAAGKVRPVQG